MATSNKLRFGAVALAAALLVACGGKKEDGGDAEVSTPDAPAVTETIETAASTDSGDLPAGAKVLVEKCVSEGEAEAVCGCQINAISSAIGEDGFNELVELAKNDDEEGAEALVTSILSEKPEAMMMMVTSIGACTEG